MCRLVRQQTDAPARRAQSQHGAAFGSRAAKLKGRDACAWTQEDGSEQEGTAHAGRRSCPAHGRSEAVTAPAELGHTDAMKMSRKRNAAEFHGLQVELVDQQRSFAKPAAKPEGKTAAESGATPEGEYRAEPKTEPEVSPSADEVLAVGARKNARPVSPSEEPSR